MAATDSQLTADLIRQGGSQEQFKLTSKDKDLIKKVQATLKEMQVAVWADVDIIRKARELGSNASFEAVLDAITSAKGTEAVQWTSVGGQKKTGHSNANQSRGPRSNQNRNGPRRDRTEAAGEHTETQHKQEGAHEESAQANGHDQRRGGARDHNKRANGHENGSDRRAVQQNGRGDRKVEKKEAPVAEKPAPVVAPVVPLNTWASIVKGKTEEPATVVVSGKDQKPQQGGKNAAKRAAAAETKSEAPAATTATATVAEVAKEAPVVAAPAVVEPVVTEAPKAAEPVVAVESAAPAATAHTDAAVAANGHASDKKEEGATGGRGSRNRRGGRRGEKETAATTEGSSAHKETAADATTEKSEAAVAAVAAAAAETPAAATTAAAAPAEKVIMPAAFSATATSGTRRGFASSHVKVASTPVAVPAAAVVAAAPAPVVAAPAPVVEAPVAAPAPVVAAAPAATATNPAANPAVATTVPPAITSSMPPHVGGPHSQMPAGFPGMGFGQFYPTHDGSFGQFYPPEMFSHMPMMGYPFMPMQPTRSHDGKSNTSSTGSNGSNPSLNTQPPMAMGYPPYMPPMNMYGYGFAGAPLQTQPPATNTGSHGFGMPAQRSSYNPRPTAAYEQEEFGSYAPRATYDQYGSTGGYHPQHTHSAHHGQEQKTHDSNKMTHGYEDHHHHQFSSFGGPSFHQ